LCNNPTVALDVRGQMNVTSNISAAYIIQTLPRSWSYYDPTAAIGDTTTLSFNRVYGDINLVGTDTTFITPLTGYYKIELNTLIDIVTDSTARVMILYVFKYINPITTPLGYVYKASTVVGPSAGSLKSSCQNCFVAEIEAGAELTCRTDYDPFNSGFVGPTWWNITYLGPSPS
jgi:hypothetical protein